MNRIPSQKAKEVLEWIRKRGTCSKQDLKDLSGLTMTTLTRILDELTSSEVIMETGLGESTGGRRPILYEINPDFAYAFGLDISRSHSILVLCDLHLNVIDARHWRMDTEMTPETLIEKATVAIYEMLAQYKVEKSKVLGLGIGAVGPLDRTVGRILEPRHFPAEGWRDIDICKLFHERLGIPVRLDNGANTAILGEYWLGDAQAFKHLLYVHVGIGIRSAMIMGGQMIYGAVDMEGSAGQMIIQVDGLPPREPGGNYGSWESYASIYGLEQEMRKQLRLGRSCSISQMDSDLADGELYIRMLEAMEAGDTLVRELFERAAAYFGTGLANLINILHPEKVILGGSLVSGHPFFFQYATQIAIGKTYHYPNYQVVFSRSCLGEEAVAVGAAIMILNQLTSN